MSINDARRLMNTILDDPSASEENGHATERRVRDRTVSNSPPVARVRAATLVVVALGAALVGAAAVTGLLFAVGAIHGSTTTTTRVVESAVASDASAAAPALDAKALYKGSAAGVVDIIAKGGGSSADHGDPFAPPGQSPGTASGTGSVIDAQGRILTASHVLNGASSITARLQDGTTRTAKLLGEDRSTDVALLQINPAELTLHPLALGSSAARPRWPSATRLR